jgi:hypothetical protein
VNRIAFAKMNRSCLLHIFRIVYVKNAAEHPLASELYPTVPSKSVKNGLHILRGLENQKCEKLRENLCDLCVSVCYSKQTLRARG